MPSAQSLGARVEGILHAVASFGANIGVFVKMEVLMDLNVVTTSLVGGAALLRRSGDGSEIRRGNTWKLSTCNPRARATEGSIPSLRIILMKNGRIRQCCTTSPQGGPAASNAKGSG
jgi:hypothetical protein